MKKIIIKKTLKTIKSNVVIDMPNKKYIVVKFIAEISSTKKYWKLILLLQFLHLAWSNKYDKRGILSYQFICFLHDGQKDLFLTMFPLSGSRYIQTLQKLPHILPKINAAKYNTDL